MFDLLAKAHIEQPRLYKLGFAHNNCGGFCVKAGKAHFKRLLETMPERYLYHEAQEQAFIDYIGKRVTILREQHNRYINYITLREFRESGTVCDPYDIGGCGCFVDGESDEKLVVAG